MLAHFHEHVDCPSVHLGLLFSLSLINAGWGGKPIITPKQKHLLIHYLRTIGDPLGGKVGRKPPQITILLGYGIQQVGKVLIQLEENRNNVLYGIGCLMY